MSAADDPRRRHSNIKILPQCALDQFVQCRISKLLPPFSVRQLGHLRVIATPLPGCFAVRALVVGTYSAAGRTDDKQYYEQVNSHLNFLLVRRDGGKPSAHSAGRAAQTYIVVDIDRSNADGK